MFTYILWKKLPKTWFFLPMKERIKKINESISMQVGFIGDLFSRESMGLGKVGVEG